MTKNFRRDEAVLLCISILAGELIFTRFYEAYSAGRGRNGYGKRVGCEGGEAAATTLSARAVTKYHRKITKMDKKYPY